MKPKGHLRRRATRFPLSTSKDRQGTRSPQERPLSLLQKRGTGRKTRLRRTTNTTPAGCSLARSLCAKDCRLTEGGARLVSMAAATTSLQKTQSMPEDAYVSQHEVLWRFSIFPGDVSIRLLLLIFCEQLASGHRVHQDGCDTQFHLEMQEVIPSVFEKQVLKQGRGGSFIPISHKPSYQGNGGTRSLLFKVQQAPRDSRKPAATLFSGMKIKAYRRLIPRKPTF